MGWGRVWRRSQRTTAVGRGKGCGLGDDSVGDHESSAFLFGSEKRILENWRNEVLDLTKRGAGLVILSELCPRAGLVNREVHDSMAERTATNPIACSFFRSLRETNSVHSFPMLHTRAHVLHSGEGLLIFSLSSFSIDAGPSYSLKTYISSPSWINTE